MCQTVSAGCAAFSAPSPKELSADVKGWRQCDYSSNSYHLTASMLPAHWMHKLLHLTETSFLLLFTLVQFSDNIIFTIINFMGRKDPMSSGWLGDAAWVQDQAQHFTSLKHSPAQVCDYIIFTIIDFMGRKDQMPSGWLGDAVWVQDQAQHFTPL